MFSGDIGQNLLEIVDVLLGSRPACDEAADFMPGVVGAPFLENYFLADLLHHIMAEYDELLVGRRLDYGLSNAIFDKKVHQLFCQDVSMAADLFIQAVGEESIELQSGEAALGVEDSVLLDESEEMLGGAATREHDCFAEDGADFRASDIEGVAVLSKELQSNVVPVGSKSITQPGTVDEVGTQCLLDCNRLLDRILCFLKCLEGIKSLVRM